MSNELIQAMAGNLQEAISIDNDYAVVDNKAYYENLPDSVTAEQADAVNAYNGDFLGASAIASFNAGKEYLEANESAATVSVEFEGSDGVTFGHVLNREVNMGEEVKEMHQVSTLKMSYGEGTAMAIAFEHMSAAADE